MLKTGTVSKEHTNLSQLCVAIWQESASVFWNSNVLRCYLTRIFVSCTFNHISLVGISHSFEHAQTHRYRQYNEVFEKLDTLVSRFHDKNYSSKRGDIHKMTTRLIMKDTTELRKRLEAFYLKREDHERLRRALKQVSAEDSSLVGGTQTMRDLKTAYVVFSNVGENFNHVTHFNTHFVVKSTRISTHSQ